MRFNVAPTDVMPIIGVNREGCISIRELRWGLIPYWAKDPKVGGAKAINARAETVDEKPMFREAFKRRRCLVPASGYFDWKPEGAAKQPYFIHDPENELLMFAGLWESWRETKGVGAGSRSTPSRSSLGRPASSRATSTIARR
jgi:putative SOS response-associated peptidase YedK